MPGTAERVNYAKGLEGVIAGETAISNVEGDIGRLSYRGVPIETLVEWDYEAVVWLVLFGTKPGDTDVAAMRAFLREEAALGAEDKGLLLNLPGNLHPMQMLQAAVPALDGSPQTTHLANIGEEARRGLVLVAKLPSLVASYHQLVLTGRMPAAASHETGLGNFLAQFNGGEPTAQAQAVLAKTQILQMEHSFNAGTFAARVVASTMAPVEAVLSAGVGALAGQLHGGADEAALREAQKVGSPAAAAGYVTDLLARKGKLMGMGHREYRKVDPRAKLLKPMAAALCRGTPIETQYLTLEALEAAFAREMAAKGKELWANVEFYKGAVFKALGVPEDYFTALFAMARAVGWLAHLLESRQDNRIIRPKALYVGL